MTLKILLDTHKAQILRKIRMNLNRLPYSSYQDFILNSEEGKSRLAKWLDLVIQSLNGGEEVFFSEQKIVGYSRAIQGFNLQNIHFIYDFFLNSLDETIQQAKKQNQVTVNDISEELICLNKILLKGWSIIAGSFLKTREEIISKQVFHLKELHNFTQKIIYPNSVEEIANIFLSKVESLFGVEACYITVSIEPKIHKIYGFPRDVEINNIEPLINKALNENVLLFSDDGNAYSNDIDSFHLKRVVIIPFKLPADCYGAIALVNTLHKFTFGTEEYNILDQFLKIVVIQIGKAFGVEKIEQKRKECHLLAVKMITIQEEERKHLSADIHDTIAQSLTGINFKLQVCKEYAKSNSELFENQLDMAVEMIQKTTDKCRCLISDLRPDLIDTAGLVPALKRLFKNFSEDSGIQVFDNLPASINISADTSICLFRIVQEGLMNIYKHSNTKTSEVKLEQRSNGIKLVVSDNGNGFEMSPIPPWIKNPDKLGLLLIKERVSGAGGKVKFITALNRGCRIEVTIPCKLPPTLSVAF